jgi:hypothetical protein
MFAQQITYGSGDETVQVVFAFLALVAVVLPIAVIWIRARARQAEARMRLIRELSAEGKLSREQLDRLLHPRSPLANLVLVVAWFALFGGIGSIVYWSLQNFPDEEFLVAGIVLIAGALATISAPVMLRELRRTEARE